MRRVRTGEMMASNIWKKCARESLVMLGLALVPTIVTAWIHPGERKSAWNRPAVAELSVAEAEVPGTSVIWVDARPEAAFGRQHVPGALSLDEEHWEDLLPGFMAAWRPGVRVVVYCDDQQCGRSREVAERLRREFQVDPVYVLKGGWAAWLEAQTP